MREPLDAQTAVAGLRRALVAALGDGAGGADAVARVCQASVQALPVDGAAISAIDGAGNRELLYASDEIIRRVESVQFTLGEGPCVDTFRARRPVLVPDLAGATAWPVFAAEVAGQPIGAIFAFPIQHGAIGIGAMDLYRRAPGWLTDDELATALGIVDLAAMALLGTQVADGQIDAWLAPLPRHRREVHQATGMLIAEFGIPADQALARLRLYAFSTGTLIEDVANALTQRRLHPAELDT